ncbi:MAG: hypothetical protein NZ750_13525 [Anaerolineae bacterium]|nr:hypothetical protein [Anaerolineae bacterium]MDW8172819.1 hypothetical protein [Anaerolineae bacterium]
MAQNDLNALLQQAIASAKRGERTLARQQLEQVIARDEDNELAWIWLAGVVNTPRERRVCLERVLAINPRNQRARQALEQLSAQESGRRAPAPVNSRRVAGGARDSSSGLTNLLIVVLVLAVIGLGGAIINRLSPPVQTVVLATSLPTEPPFTRTPVPTITPPIVIVTRSLLPTLAPTFTPTATFTPSSTPSPAPTDFPLRDYQLLYAARARDQAQPDLFAIRADGSAEQRLLSQAGQMAFSADGQRLTFIRQQPSTLAEADQGTDETALPAVVGEIYLAESANLEAARQVSRLEVASAFSPRLSPDGTLIVFYSPYDGDDELWLLNSETQLVSKLTDNEEITDRDPSWSPDGRQIVFSSDRQSPGLPDLYVLTLNEGAEPEVRLLIDNPGSSTAPAWSPDGRWIAYLNDNGGSANVWVVGADGQRNQRVTISTAEDRAPSWSPDARFIAFASNRQDERFQLYIVEWTTRQVTRITQHELDVSATSFRPDLLMRLRLRP